MAAPVSFSSYQQSLALGTWDIGPVDFKQFLLAALNDPCEIMELLSEREPPWGEVVILHFEGIKYVLVCDAEALPRSIYLSILLIVRPTDSTLAFDSRSSMMISSTVIFSLNTNGTNDTRSSRRSALRFPSMQHPPSWMETSSYQSVQLRNLKYPEMKVTSACSTSRPTPYQCGPCMTTFMIVVNLFASMHR